MSRAGQQRQAFPVQQHFVPKVLQKRFLDPEGKLWVMRAGGQPFHVRPEEAFKARHIYTQVDEEGTRSAELEDAYSKLESRADRLLGSIVEAARTDTFPTLTSDDWGEFLVFYIMQYRRAPSFMQTVIDNGRQSYVEDLEKTLQQSVGLTEDEKARHFDPANLARDMKNALLRSQGEIRPWVWNTMAGRGMAVAHIELDNRRFILGDWPFARFLGSQSADLSDQTVEMWLPIAPDVAISSYGPRGNGRFIRLLDERAVRHFNMQIARNCNTIASSSRELVVSLMRRRSEPATRVR